MLSLEQSVCIDDIKYIPRNSHPPCKWANCKLVHYPHPRWGPIVLVFYYPMTHLDFLLSHLDEYWNGWLKYCTTKIASKQRKKAGIIQKPKTYTHFSKKITDLEEIKRLKWFILDRRKISQHSFNPLLFFLKKVPIFERIINPSRSYEKHKKLYQNPKKPYKMRPLMYADHLDSLIYSWYSYMISFWYEERLKERGIGDFVAAYRSDIYSTKKLTNSSVSDELFRVLRWVDPKKKYRVILFDVQKFYDTLDPNILKKMWCYVLGTNNLPPDHFSVFKSIVEYTVVDQRQLSMYLNKKGTNMNTRNIWKLCTEKEFHDLRQDGLFIKKEVFLSTISPIMNPEKEREFYELVRNKPIPKWIPQGLVISPILANIYMFNFDDVVGKKVSERWWFYRRYADDIWIICEEEYADEIRDLVMEEIQKLNLNIQTKKTQEYVCEDLKVRRLDTCTTWDKLAFTYLGLTYRDGKWYIRNGTIAKWRQKISKIIRQAFWKKKSWEEVDLQDVYKKIMNLWLFRYMKMCSKDHGKHVLNQFSKKKIKKEVQEMLLKLDKYPLGKPKEKGKSRWKMSDEEFYKHFGARAEKVNSLTKL